MKTIYISYRWRNNYYLIKSTAIRKASDFVHASTLNVREEVDEITEVRSGATAIEWSITDVVILDKYA